MKNERKTEQIVRSHFKSESIIRIEEQSSDIPKVDKLLKIASKKGTGKGFPEFIITFDSNNNFLIVVECKADITKHESQNRDKYADFAVDGALLYASFLSKEYDVLAIAVSGETQQQLKVYDNCTGTGGFLISAMKYMIKDAAGEESKIREIKEAA